MKKLTLLFALFALSFIGCSPKAPYDVVPIEGTVTYDGKPIPRDFAIKFRPDNGMNESTGNIQEGGKFKAIHTVDIDGVPTGKCTIRIMWNGSLGTNAPAEYQPLLQKYGFQSEGLPLEITKKDKNVKIDFPAVTK
ncbi:MAG: hypothetical protein LBJ67_17725 [Planctomycetaceae bacterium]|jgi:hypothetical protein|nr:hypothetical protein [Planctomycetaceae bacterium]